jgi:ribosomal-protein-alanine N-acetyltransferase
MSQQMTSKQVASQLSDIETERLVLRGPTAADLDDWVATIFGDPEVMKYMPRVGEPASAAAKVLDSFTQLREQQQVGAWVITSKADGRFMGHSILAHRAAFDEPELGYALGKAFWGQGYATEVARAVVRYGFEQANLPRVFAVVFPENEPSWRILKHLGFEYEKDVTHYDLPLAYYALNREQLTHLPGSAEGFAPVSRPVDGRTGDSRS